MHSNIKMKKYRGKLFIYIFLQLIKYGLFLLPPYCYLIFLNEVLTKQRFDRLAIVLMLYILIFLIKTAVSVLLKRTYNKIFPVMIMDYKKMILEQYSQLDLYMLQDYTSGELKERLHKDTENAVLYFEKKLEVVIAMVSISITIIILLYLNWIMAIACFLLLPFSFAVTRYIKGRSNVEYERIRQILGKYNDFMINHMFFWKEVKANRLEKYQQNQFEVLWNDIGVSFLKAHMCWFMNRTFLAFKDVFLTKMGLYLMGGILVIKGLATIPILLSFMEYYTVFINRILEVANIIMKRGEQEESLKRIDAIMKLKLRQKLKIIEHFDSVEFQNVYFSYNENQENILENFCMKINKGESVAIIGESGCGKSTLIKLMSGCLIPKKGKILWNSNDMDELNPKAIYDKVGFLMQDSTMFNLTIQENLLFGKRDANEKEMKEACEKANIMDFIESLPMGFKTIIGENGIRLSGGQKQRLMIARLFLKNPEVIVFDEATSALDYENESEILNLLLQNKGEKTFLMITHRKTSLSRCDRVIQL